MKNLAAAVRLLLTLECEQSSHLVSESLDRDLTPVERWAVRLHRVGCWSCRRFGKQIRLIRETAKRSGTSVENSKLSPEAHQRIRNAILRTDLDGPS